jgi:hypothetical protein
VTTDEQEEVKDGFAAHDISFYEHRTLISKPASSEQMIWSKQSRNSVIAKGTIDYLVNALRMH